MPTEVFALDVANYPKGYAQTGYVRGTDEKAPVEISSDKGL
jgi:hypothetical protein